MTIDLSAIIQGAFGIGFSLLLYFIKSATERLEKAVEDLRETQTTIRIMQSQLLKIESDVKDASKFAVESSALVNRVTILERNLETAFKKIDECKMIEKTLKDSQEKHNDLVRSRTHFIQNKLMVLKAAVEKQSSSCFTDDWRMP
jgi:predicted  nucleic acid-binding Zn-ribbon protein